MICISSGLDSGAIEVVEAQSCDAIELRIRRDSKADFFQWFHFRLTGARAQNTVIRFSNAGECSYPQGWHNYQAVASYDREHWFRVPSTYVDGVLEVRHIPEADVVHYAYFEPYSAERHLNFLAHVQAFAPVHISVLGRTLEGRDLDLVRIAGGADSNCAVWVIARQHPGETMAEWFAQGLIERLVDAADPVTARALQLADFYIVPNMNPDGAACGNLRTNAAGANLNREWQEPSMARSPEVFCVRAAMEARGVHLFIDAHGDEALPYVFVAGCEMLPNFSAQQGEEQANFVTDLKQASPDFQDRVGYPAGRYGADTLKLASKWIGHRYGCLSLTLEMPFKDNANRPDARYGWNGARSRRLGHDILQPIVGHLTRCFE